MGHAIHGMTIITGFVQSLILKTFWTARIQLHNCSRTSQKPASQPCQDSPTPVPIMSFSWLRSDLSLSLSLATLCLSSAGQAPEASHSQPFSLCMHTDLGLSSTIHTHTRRQTHRHRHRHRHRDTDTDTDTETDTHTHTHSNTHTHTHTCTSLLMSTHFCEHWHAGLMWCIMRLCLPAAFVHATVRPNVFALAGTDYVNSRNTDRPKPVHPSHRARASSLRSIRHRTTSNLQVSNGLPDIVHEV